MALLSQELFDEAVVENEECFDLSPAEALRETIDQFRQQLGGSDVVGTSNDGGAGHAGAGNVPSPTSVAGSEENGAGGNGPNIVPAALSHLVLSHPDSAEGRRERAARGEFQSALTLLDGCVSTDGTVAVDGAEGVIEALAKIGRLCRLGDAVDDDDNNNCGGRSSLLPYCAIFQQTSSIYTLMSFLGVVDPLLLGGEGSLSQGECSKQDILSATARALSAILSNGPADDGKCTRIRAELRDSFVPALGRLVCLAGGFVKAAPSPESPSEVLCDLLKLGTNATRGCEGGKVAFVQSALPAELKASSSPGAKRGGAEALVSCLALHTAGGDDDTAKILTEACQLLASLCRYDDFRDPSASSGAMGAAGVNASSAHDHAVEFQRAGAVPLLIGIAREVLSKLEGDSDEASERLAASALTALRVLAINDEIIQTMVALGVLPIVTEALRLCVPEENSENESGSKTLSTMRQRLAAASLGLLRNLCGNDEIKTNLCLGSTDQQSASATPSILPHLLRAMRTFSSTAQIQEHACGALAAMALRRPTNARAILDADGPRCVLTAMRKHPENASLQRQGALAVRNVVSRLLRELPEGEGTAAEGDERTSLRDAFLELGAEDVLRNVAGRHQGSVDEAYAALRDLGCTVSLVKFNAAGLQGGQSASVGRTMMFGEKHNSAFRPVYEESAGLSDGVDSAAAQFGA